LKKLIGILLIVAAAWLSSPTTSGWYWVKINSGDAIMIYVDMSEKVVTLCDPTVGQCAKGTLDNIRPGVTFQGPIKPEGAGQII
jgi:hypothetical protein